MSALNTLSAPAQAQQPPAAAPRPAPKAATPPRSQPTATPKPAPTATPKPAPQPPAPPPAVAPQAPATQVPAAQPTGNAEKKYTGTPIRLDFQGADLRSVLRVFADISGLNMVIDPDVQGHGRHRAERSAVGPGARRHPAGQQLDYTVDGTIVRIAQARSLTRRNRSRGSS